MSNLCPYADNCNQPCPLEQRTIEAVEPCAMNKRGETCGAAAAYGMLVHEFKGLWDVDIVAPILGTFNLTDLPDEWGIPPSFAEQYAGVQLPLRFFPVSSELREPRIMREDLILSLLAHGKLEIVEWFLELGSSQTSFPASRFNHVMGNMVLRTAGEISSQEYYGDGLEEAQRSAIESLVYS